MSLLIEALGFQDGHCELMSYHNERVNRSRRALLSMSDNWRLEDRIQVPDEFMRGKVRCRVLYGEQLDRVEFSAYIPRRIESLLIVRDDSIDYSFKYADRRRLQQLHELRGNCDDVLIARHGVLTDSTFSNLMFERGDRRITPENSLLAGVRRAALLDRGYVRMDTVRPEQVHFDFDRVHLINALLAPGDCVVSVDRIYGV